VIEAELVQIVDTEYGVYDAQSDDVRASSELCEADGLKTDIERLVGTITDELHSLASQWIRLGMLLNTAQKKQYWKQWGHTSWGSYLQSISGRLERGRSQLYEYLGVVQKLLPVAGEETLAKIGISKARELKRIYGVFQKSPPPEIIEVAAGPATINELREAIYDNLNQKEPEKEKYAYSTIAYRLPRDEQEVLERAKEIALKTDPVVQPNVSPEQQWGEALWRWAVYYLGGKEAEVLGYETGGEG
jgi:hypothetical protein